MPAISFRAGQGAIAIDLMPAVLVLILCVVQAGIRREGEPQASTSTMTAAELIAALRIAREVEVAGAAVSPEARERIAQAAASEPENVTDISAARAKKE